MLLLYDKINRKRELRIKRIPITIVALCNTFSGPRFVTAHIPPDIVERLRETFLFCISTIAMRSIARMTSLTERN